MVRPEHTALRMHIGANPGGQIKGIELYPECDYAASIHYVFDMDEIVRYIRFREVLAEKGRCTQG